MITTRAAGVSLHICQAASKASADPRKLTGGTVDGAEPRTHLASNAAWGYQVGAHLHETDNTADDSGHNNQNDKQAQHDREGFCLFTVFFFACKVFRSPGAVPVLTRRVAQWRRWGPCRLVGTGSCQRKSAKTSCSSASSLATSHSPATGVPTARPRRRSALQLLKAAAQPITTKRQRLGVRLAPIAAGCPKERPVGLDVGPRLCLARAGDRAGNGTWMRRSSITATSMFMSAERTLRAMRAPASLGNHTRQLALEVAPARQALPSWRMWRNGQHVQDSSKSACAWSDGQG